MTRLQTRWEALMKEIGAPELERQSLWTQIYSAYSEPHRHYHTLRHIRRVLDVTELLYPLTRDYCAVRLAAWFHDAVYDTRATDNEERSARQAERALQALAYPGADRVAELILATKRHENPDLDPDRQVLLDADLEVLGARPERYDAYTRAIRAEYAWVPVGAYREARSALLRSFLDRDWIYGTAPMRRTREDRARANLGRELRRLAALNPMPPQ